MTIFRCSFWIDGNVIGIFLGAADMLLIFVWIAPFVQQKTFKVYCATMNCKLFRETATPMIIIVSLWTQTSLFIYRKLISIQKLRWFQKFVKELFKNAFKNQLFVLQSGQRIRGYCLRTSVSFVPFFPIYGLLQEASFDKSQVCRLTSVLKVFCYILL